MHSCHFDTTERTNHQWLPDAPSFSTLSHLVFRCYHTQRIYQVGRRTRGPHFNLVPLQTGAPSALSLLTNPLAATTRHQTPRSDTTRPSTSCISINTTHPHNITNTQQQDRTPDPPREHGRTPPSDHGRELKEECGAAAQAAGLRRVP